MFTHLVAVKDTRSKQRGRKKWFWADPKPGTEKSPESLAGQKTNLKKGERTNNSQDVRDTSLSEGSEDETLSGARNLQLTPTRWLSPILTTVVVSSDSFHLLVRLLKIQFPKCETGLSYGYPKMDKCIHG